MLSNKKKKTPWPLVRKRTIPTERPPLVGEGFVKQRKCKSGLGFQQNELAE
jgi:hypothetical protein